MHKTFRYIMLFAILALIQACFINRLIIGTWFLPLVYACFVVMLPMQLSRMQTLLIGAMVGFLMDIFTGTAGLNTAATTAIAYMRPALLRYVVGQEEIRDGGTPSHKRFSHNRFYFLSFYLLLAHSFIYFGLESLSSTMWGTVMVRVAVSTVISMIAIRIIDRTFNARGTN